MTCRLSTFIISVVLWTLVLLTAHTTAVGGRRHENANGEGTLQDGYKQFPHKKGPDGAWRGANEVPEHINEERRNARESRRQRHAEMRAARQEKHEKRHKESTERREKLREERRKRLEEQT
jgi:hypothetical protein